MYRKNKKRSCIYSVTALFFLLFTIPAGAGTLVTTDPIITDVIPLAFSVVWSANQPSTPSLEVYADDGTVPVAGCTITNESGAHAPAENNGVMKVMVSGCLNPGGSYYFKTVTTSKDSGEVRNGDLTPVQMNGFDGYIIRGSIMSAAYGNLRMSSQKRPLIKLLSPLDTEDENFWAI